MELKLYRLSRKTTSSRLLIVPYGIETFESPPAELGFAVF